MQSTHSDEDVGSPELGAAQVQRDARPSNALRQDPDSSAAAPRASKVAGSKTGEGAAAGTSKRKDATDGSRKPELQPPDTVVPLSKRLEQHKRSLSSDSEHQDQGPTKKRRGRPSKAAAAAAAAATAAPAAVEGQEAAAAAGQGAAKRKRGRPSKAALAAAGAAAAGEAAETGSVQAQLHATQGARTLSGLEHSRTRRAAMSHTPSLRAKQGLLL